MKDRHFNRRAFIKSTIASSAVTGASLPHLLKERQQSAGAPQAPESAPIDRPGVTQARPRQQS